MLKVSEILLILDKIGREVIVSPSKDFGYEIVSARSSGYHEAILPSGHPLTHKDPEIRKLQAKLLIMLTVARAKERNEAHGSGSID